MPKKQKKTEKRLGDLSEIGPLPKTPDGVEVEEYNIKDGPSPEAIKTASKILEFIRTSFVSIIEHEMSEQKEKFNLQKFTFDFGCNIKNILKLKFPHLEDIYLKDLNLSDKQMIMLNSFIINGFGVPFAMVLSEWFDAVNNGMFSNGGVDETQPEEEMPSNSIKFPKGTVVN